MKTLLTLTTIALTPLFTLQAGEKKKDGGGAEIEETDVVPSGTYEGVAHKVDDTEKEIYVKTGDDKILELYLEDSTKIMKDGEAVEFDEVEKGQNLRVTVEKEGKSLKPLEVVILD